MQVRTTYRFCSKSAQPGGGNCNTSLDFKAGHVIHWLLQATLIGLAIRVISLALAVLLVGLEPLVPHCTAAATSHTEGAGEA